MKSMKKIMSLITIGFITIGGVFGANGIGHNIEKPSKASSMDNCEENNCALNNYSYNYKYEHNYQYNGTLCNGTECNEYKHKYKYNYTGNVGKGQKGQFEINNSTKEEMKQNKGEKTKVKRMGKFKVNTKEIIEKAKRNKHQFMRNVTEKLQENKQMIMKIKERVMLKLKNQGKLDNETREEVINLIQETLATKIEYLIGLITGTNLEEEYLTKLEELLNNINNTTNVTELKNLVKEYKKLKIEITVKIKEENIKETTVETNENTTEEINNNTTVEAEITNTTNTTE